MENLNSQWQTDSKNPSKVHDLLRERENAKQNVAEKGEKTEGARYGLQFFRGREKQ